MGVAGGDCGLPDWLAAKPFSRGWRWHATEKSSAVVGEIFKLSGIQRGGGGGEGSHSI